MLKKYIKPWKTTHEDTFSVDKNQTYTSRFGWFAINAPRGLTTAVRTNLPASTFVIQLINI